MSETSGRILTLTGELPHHLNVEQIGMALIELDLEVTGMRESPVARLESPLGAWNSTEALGEEITDYRRFWVEFAPEATKDDVVAVTGVVFAALQRLNSQI
jgi:hypothetical protein